MSAPKLVTKCEVLRLHHPTDGEWIVGVNFQFNDNYARVLARYQDDDEELVQIVDWEATYVSPCLGDQGHVALGNGRIDLEVAQLRGIGLGSLLMRPLITWMKSRPSIVDVANIDLAWQDAQTEETKGTRNKFYEKLGFDFDYRDAEKTEGVSKNMKSDQLVIPQYRMSRCWKVESIDGIGEVFQQ